MIKTGSLNNLIIESTSSLVDAMGLIDKNGKGICFVTDSDVLVGILTDGDIRRALLSNENINEKVQDVMQRDFISLKVGSNIQDIQAELVKVDLIPIVNEQNEIVDYASRDRFHQIPLTQPIFDGNELEYITDCINTGWISSVGKYVTMFEDKFAEYTGSKHTCAVSNGTVALHLALVTLGIKPGDEVIVPNLTFASPINAVIYCGAIPVLVDVDKDTMVMGMENLKKAITSKTAAIIPVHLYGYPAPMTEIMNVARENNIIVIEDCAEALGSFYDDKHVGCYGDAGTFSFFGNKTITTGEGGMIIFNDKEKLNHAKMLRDHGMSKKIKYWHEHIGFNYRMTNMQAAIGVAQMEAIDKLVQAKQFIAEEYKKNIQCIDGIQLPNDADNIVNSYWLYTIVLPHNLSSSRDKIIEIMLKDGIEARPVFFPMSDMPPYQEYIRKEVNFDVSRYLSSSAISLPSGANLTKQDIKRTSMSLKNAIEKVKDK